MALLATGNHQYRDNQQVVTGIVSRIVVISEFEATVKAIVNGTASQQRRSTFSKVVKLIAQDIERRSYGMSPTPLRSS